MLRARPKSHTLAAKPCAASLADASSTLPAAPVLHISMALKQRSMQPPAGMLHWLPRSHRAHRCRFTQHVTHSQRCVLRNHSRSVSSLEARVQAPARQTRRTAGEIAMDDGAGVQEGHAGRHLRSGGQHGRHVDAALQLASLRAEPALVDCLLRSTGPSRHQPGCCKRAGQSPTTCC